MKVDKKTKFCLETEMTLSIMSIDTKNPEIKGDRDKTKGKKRFKNLGSEGNDAQVKDEQKLRRKEANLNLSLISFEAKHCS